MKKDSIYSISRFNVHRLSNRFLKWLTIFVGACATGAAGALYFKNKDKNKLDITKVTPQSPNGKDDDQKKWPPTMNISTIQSATVPPNLDNN